MQPSAEAVAFISYAREDRAFVFALRDSLKTQGVDSVGDWLLTPGQKYEVRLRELNLSSQALVFIISPDSLKSEACLNELALAVENKKQVLPVSRRDHGEDKNLDSALRAPQWTFLREADDFETNVKGLVKAINTDFDLMQTHGRLLLAAENWNNNGRNRSYLLRKDGLREAESWLARTSAQPDKLPQPTPLEIEFIFSGRRARSQAARIALGAVLAITLTLTVLTIVAFAQRSRAIGFAKEAQAQTILANKNETKALANAEEAEKQKMVAQAKAIEAEQQRQRAEDNLTEAKRQQTIAKANEVKANHNAAEARKQQMAAEENARRAVEVGKRRLMVATLLLNPEGYSFTSVGSQNHDLDFGIRPWSLRDKSLNGILGKFQAEQPETFTRIFGGGDASLARRVLDYTANPSAELDDIFISNKNPACADNERVAMKDTEPPTDSPEGNLNREPWVSRFKEAGTEPTFQAIQLREYSDLYLKFENELLQFAPEIKTERGVAFMLDLAFNVGTRNAKNYFLQAKAAGPTQNEIELLRRIAEISVEHIRRRFSRIAPGISRRRQMFLTTPFFSDKELGF